MKHINITNIVMKYTSIWIAWRYVWAKKSINIIHIIMWASICSVTIAIASLIIILSIYNGMAESTYQQFSTVCPDILLKKADRSLRFEYTPSQKAILSTLPNVLAVSSVLEQEALLTYQDTRILIRLVGVDSFFKEVVQLQEYTKKQTWDLGSENIPLLILSSRAANQLHIDADNLKDPLLVSTIRQGEQSPTNLLTDVSSDYAYAFTTYFELAGELNELPIVYTNLEFVQQLTHTPSNQLSNIYVRVVDGQQLSVQKSIQKIFPSLVAQNRFEQNETYFMIFSAEKKMLLLVIFFMLIVSMTGSMGTLKILFLEKIRHAKILYCLGHPMKNIQQIFLYQSIFINLIGLVLGLGIGFLIILSQVFFQWIKMEGSTYSIPYEVHIAVLDIVMIIAVILGINAIAIFLAMRGLNKKIRQGIVRNEG